MSHIDTQPPIYEDLRLLTEVSQLLTLLDLDSVMQKVISLMSSAVGATKASLFLHDGNNVDWDHIFLMRDLDPGQSIEVVQAVLDEGLAGWVIRNRQETIVYDTQTDERWHRFPNDTNAARSVMCVPFIHDDKVLAVLTLVHPAPNHFDEHHLRLMTIVANQATVAIRNAQLFNQVQQQQQQLEVILHAIPDILLVLDEESRIMLVNEPAKKLLSENNANSQELMIGEYLNRYVDIDPAIATVQRIVSKAEPAHLRPFETRSERSQQDFLVTMSAWENPGRKTAGFVVVMHDVTTLRDLHRFKDEMLKVVTHDLRSPVSLVISASEMLTLDMPPLDAESAIPQYLEIIRQATDRMQGLLDDLLRAETSALRPTDPSELIEAIVTDLQPLAAKKAQTLESQINLASELILIVDPMLVREAMENYVSNAIKYTGQKGRIILRAHTTDDNRFHFVVEDNGIGVAEEHLSHLFEPYYRVQRPETEDVEGYGVGLSLVKAIVERYKGEVWVESREGKGSRFGFWLPM
jgi:signal transduction histidine kinase